MRVKIMIYTVNSTSMITLYYIILFLEEGLPVLHIQEFRSSEEYHFHSKKQMELVSMMCPEISKVYNIAYKVWNKDIHRFIQTKNN